MYCKVAYFSNFLIFWSGILFFIIYSSLFSRGERGYSGQFFQKWLWALKYFLILNQMNFCINIIVALISLFSNLFSDVLFFNK